MMKKIFSLLFALQGMAHGMDTWDTVKEYSRKLYGPPSMSLDASISQSSASSDPKKSDNSAKNDADAKITQAACLEKVETALQNMQEKEEAQIMILLSIRLAVHCLKA